MIIIRWIINALALLLVAKLVAGFQVDSFYAALIAALLLGLVNATIRPLLIFFTLPINVVTLGLFTLVINALMLELVATIVKGFTIHDFKAAFIGSLLLWLISWFTSTLLTEKKNPEG